MTVRPLPVAAAGFGDAAARTVAGPGLPDLADVVSSAAHALLVTTDDGVVTYASPQCHELLGLDAGAILGRSLLDLVDPVDRDRVGHAAERTRMRSGPGSVGFAVAAELQRPRLLEAEVTVLDTPLDHSSPSLSAAHGLVWSLRALDLRHRSARDDETAAHDELTTLPDRALFVAGVDRALHRQRREHTRAALLVLGVDDFSPTWSDVGHRAAGDLISAVASRLEAAARPGDHLGRVAIDRLAVWMDGVRDVAESDDVVGSILAEIAGPVDANGLSMEPVVTARVVQVDARLGTCGEEALTAAEHAPLFRSARQATSPLRPASDVRRDRDLADDLRRGLAENQVRPAYQPIVDLASGDLTGFEALARWDHPELGVVSPSVFVPLAEQHHLVEELGRHMLVAACRQFESWRQAHPERPIRIGVNASPRQLAGPTMLDDIRRALDFSGLPPEHLVVEITESGVHRDLAGIRRLLDAMHEIGVRTAMDDFGTGHSSLAYLRRLPIDILKIDRSFVMDTDDAGPGYLAAIAAVGHELGLDVLAEGVETAAQEAAVVRAGCDFAQGFLFARPLDADAAERLILSPHRIRAGAVGEAVGEVTQEGTSAAEAASA